jgi:CheY-like chemotaxis protein
MKEDIVLLVEDDDDFRTLFSEVLREEGFEVVEASNGVEAVAALDSVQPAIIVLDLVMPVMNGWSLFATLRHRPSLRDTPVFFLSGMAELAPAGGALTIAKPLTLQALTQLLDAMRSPGNASPKEVFTLPRPN